MMRFSEKLKRVMQELQLNQIQVCGLIGKSERICKPVSFRKADTIRRGTEFDRYSTWAFSRLFFKAG